MHTFTYNNGKLDFVETMSSWKWAVVRIGVNFACPGLGIIIDAAVVGYDIYSGDKISATIGLGMLVIDVSTMGLTTGVTATAKEAAIKAAKETAKAAKNEALKTGGKQAAKEVGKKLGQDISIGIAKDSFKTIAKEGIKEATKTTLKDVLLTSLSGIIKAQGFKTVSVEIGEKFISYIIETTGKKGSKFIMNEALQEAAKRAALECGKRVKDIKIITECGKTVVKFILTNF